MDFPLGLMVKKVFGPKNLNFANFLSCNLTPAVLCESIIWEIPLLITINSPYSSRQNKKMHSFL